MVEVATFGETMLRLSPPTGERIESTDSLECRTAGAESNVAIAAARLGTDAAWLSKLPDSVLGRRVATLADGAEQAGRHATVLDAGQMPSGTYFVRMRAGDFQQTRRLTIVQ